jgi:hypothetical protein
MAESLSCSPTRTFGLSTTSTAPSCNARIVNSLDDSAKLEQTTTGSGVSSISLRRNVRPSMRGISRSSTITSGSRVSIFVMAMSGSAAVVTDIVDPRSVDIT